MTDPRRCQRKSKIIELDAALANVRNGMTIGIGGFINSSHPDAGRARLDRVGDAAISRSSGPRRPGSRSTF